MQPALLAQFRFNRIAMPGYLKETINVLKFTTMYPFETDSSLLGTLYSVWKFFFTVSVTVYFCQSVLELILVEKFVAGVHGYLILTIGTCGDGLFSILYFRWIGRQQAAVREFICENFKYKSEDGLEERNMEKAVKYSRFISLYWTTQCAISAFIVAFWPVFGSSERILPLPARYPYDWTQTPFYELTIALQVITNIFLILGIVGNGLPIICVALHISSQFQILCCDIRNLVHSTLLQLGYTPQEVAAYRDGLLVGNARRRRPLDDVVTSELFARICEERFEKCIEMHRMLIVVCDMVEELYKNVTLVKSGTWIFYIMFITLSFTKIPCTSFVLCFGLVLYLCELLVTMFYFAFAGHLIVKNVEDLYDSLYSIPWYLCSSKIKFGVLFMQMRCKRGTKLTVGKMFDLDLMLFANVVETGVSYFIILYQLS